MSLGLAIAVHSYGYQDNVTDADALIVLGAGLGRTGRPTAAQRVRSTRAAELWHEGYAPYIICTGGVPWFLTERSEADACRDILLEQGVPDDAILLENRSRSTQENALYSRDIMEARGWRTALVVSDRYHLLRANWLFSTAGIQTATTPATVSYLRPERYAYHVAREVAALEWQAVANLLNLPLAMLYKRRTSPTDTEVTHVIGDVADMRPIFIDDMITTAGTMRRGIDSVLRLGAREDITVAATHGVFTPPAMERLSISAVSKLVVTDTVDAARNTLAGRCHKPRTIPARLS